MLKNWRSHSDYQKFLISSLKILFKSIPDPIKKIESIISKLYCLNLDILHEILKPTYSSTGRPATFQPEIFRSFCLMLFKKETSITEWVDELRSNELLATCIGCAKGKTPSLGAHYDFISRLWLSDLSSDRHKQKQLKSYKKKPSKTKSPGKNKFSRKKQKIS